MTHASLTDLDLKRVIEEIQDHLAPKLDTYEQAIYLYVFRHTRLIGILEATIGFKSGRRKMNMGVGERGKPMSENTCYEKLRSLQAKGCLEIVDTTRNGTKLRLKLPSEISGIIPAKVGIAALNIEEMDFFNVPENRVLILRRDGNRCFYCLRAVDKSNYVIEHVSSRPDGDSSYRNVVTAYRSCNNKKGDHSAEDFLRSLYRNGFLAEEELEKRLSALNQLLMGALKPDIAL